jgi:hypothetical protein
MQAMVAMDLEDSPVRVARHDGKRLVRKRRLVRSMPACFTRCDMRCFIAAVLLIGTLICPKEAKALDCAWPGGWQYEAADGVDAPVEKQRHDAEARATLESLERTPIIFRGRFASARYLSDLRKTNVPTSLLIFDHVEILKGRLPRTSIDGKAFIIKEEWCNGSCIGKERHWPKGDTVVISARPNDFVDPSRAVDFASKRVVYKGRIDAVLGVCSRGGVLSPMALELLNAPDDEIARLKREYLPRRPQ